MVAAHLITGDPELAAEVGRIALLAAVPVSVGSSGPPEARLLLVGPDALPLPRGPGARLVVTTTDVSVELLEAALACGATGVLRLPADEARLVHELIAAEESERPGRVLAVVGASGGVGASCFAAAWAQACAPALLLDADPLGAGLDVTLGLEELPGPRWSDLAGARGRLSPEALRTALPQRDGVAVVAHDGSAVPATALAAVVSAGLGEGGTVVLDLPRFALDWVATAGVRLDEAVLVVADDVPGVLAGARVLAAVRALGTRVRIALLRSGGGVAVDDAERALGAEVALRLPVGGRRLAGPAPARSWVRAARELR